MLLKIRRISSPAFLLFLFSAVVFPLLVFAGYLLFNYAGAERENYEREALISARQVTTALDREIEGMISMLQTLSTSPSLNAGELQRFHQQTRELAKLRDVNFVLRDEKGAEIANSAFAFGLGPLDSVNLPGLDEKIFDSPKPYVSDLFFDPLTGKPNVAVYLPIVTKKGHRYHLGVRISSTHLLTAIKPNIPPGWYVGVGDRSGKIILRSIDNDKFAGQPVFDDYVRKAIGREGNFTASNRMGDQLLVGYAYSNRSGWLVGTNMHLDKAQEPLRASVALFLAFGIFALLLSGGLALLFGRRLTASMSDLANNALVVGRGEVVEPNRLFLRELELAGRALSRASRDLAERSLEREKALERQHLLMNELNHRVKNTLATVQSIALQTLRHAKDLPEAGEAITARLMALARAQDVLTRESWEGADLSSVIDTALAPHLIEGRLFSCNGPAVWLTPRATLALSLAFHELATNATKYGAFAKEGGQVAIIWETQRETSNRFILEWRETGGPPVEKPARQGFGSRLIERNLGSELFAEVSIEYSATGLIFQMETLLPHIEDPEPTLLASKTLPLMTAQPSA